MTLVSIEHGPSPAPPFQPFHDGLHGSVPPPLPAPRLLRLEVAELARSIAVTRRVVPQVPLLDNDVAALQKVGGGGGGRVFMRGVTRTRTRKRTRTRTRRTRVCVLGQVSCCTTAWQR